MTISVRGEREKMIDWLLEFLPLVEGKNAKALVLQIYIETYGAIPNEYAEAVRKAMDDNDYCSRGERREDADN